MRIVEKKWQQLTSTGADVPRRGDVEVVLHLSRVWTKRCGSTLVYKTTPDLTRSSRLPTNTSAQPNTNRVGALISSHPGNEVTPVGPGRTSTAHGCLVRQEGCGWPTTKPLCTRRCGLETPSFTSMVVEPQYDHCRQIHLTRHFSLAQCACLTIGITPTLAQVSACTRHLISVVIHDEPLIVLSSFLCSSLCSFPSVSPSPCSSLPTSTCTLS